MTALPETPSKAKQIPRWGGFWETVSTLIDWDDAKHDFQREVEGFTALEACTTITQVKETILKFFSDKTVRDRLNSPVLDQLFLLSTAPLKTNVYFAATVFGFTETLMFLLQLADAPSKEELSQVLGWAKEHQQKDIVKYLTITGVEQPRFVFVPASVQERVSQGGSVPRDTDMLLWVEPLENGGPPITLRCGGNPVLTFSQRYVFQTPVPFALLYLNHFDVTGPVRYLVADITDTERDALLRRTESYRLVIQDQWFVVQQGLLIPQYGNASAFLDVMVGDTRPDPGGELYVFSFMPALRHVTLPNLSDELVQEIKRLTGYSYIRLFGVR